jgi:predicted small secreted protein
MRRKRTRRVSIMPRSIRSVAFSVPAAVLLVSVVLSACGTRGSEDVVAKVGGRAITKKQFEHWLSVEGASGAPANGVSPGKRAMQSLISAEWTRAQASELGVHVGNAEAEQQLSLLDYAGSAGLGGRGLFAHEAELKKEFASKALTHADRLSLVELNLLASKIEQKSRLLAERQITHAQLARYYEQNRRRFDLPEEREFTILQTHGKPAVLRAKREIEAGKGFLSVAKRVSIDSEAPDGVQRLKRGEEEPYFVARIFAAKLHVLTGPFKVVLDYYIFKLIRITPRRPRTLTEAEPMIRRLLVDQESGRALTELADARTSAWKARTSCDVGYVVPLCGQHAGAK